MTILVVDDDPHTRALHSHFLRKAGYRVLTAGSGVEAFELLQLDRPQPSVALEMILMDLMMPEVDGLEACRRIRASRAYQGVPIVFITASDPDESRLAAFDSGAVDFLTKPVDKDRLLERVAALLRLKREVDRGAPAAMDPALDSLTGLPNRARFEALLAEVWQSASRKGSSVSLLVVELDFWKRVREHVGAEAADAQLRRVVEVLKAGARPADVLGRTGESELSLLMPDAEPPTGRTVARQLRTSLRKLAEDDPAFAVSLGLASARPRQGGSPDGLAVLADGAASCAQSAGHNQVAAVELL